MNQKFTDFIAPIRHKNIAIAVSGGADSLALLHMSMMAGLKIVALHVNHKLRPDADADAAHVQSMANAWGIDIQILTWAGDKPNTGIEDAARTARYKLMTDYCQKNGIDILMVAHHADDQIETFLMNLARGSGVYGLAAMRPITIRDGIKIMRPLLTIRREELRTYCVDHGITFVHDEMNDDEHYARVRMRRRRACLTKELGISDDRILLAIKNLGRTRDALDDYIAQRQENLVHDNRAIFDAFFLFDEAPDIRLKLLGNLLHQIGGNNYPPRLDALERALKRLGGDCKFTLGGCVLRRLGEKILIAPEGARTSFKVRKGNEKTKQHSKA